MDARLIKRIEKSVERLASAAFGGAVGYAVFALTDLPQPELGGCVVVSAAIAYSLSSRGLAALAAADRQFVVPAFVAEDIDFGEPDELLLTDADRLQENELVLTEADRLNAVADEPLLLDDVLSAMGPDSRVVRLFDRKAMPTPGELKDRIDNHVGRTPQNDASQALAEALAELRRSLR